MIPSKSETISDEKSVAVIENEFTSSFRDIEGYKFQKDKFSYNLPDDISGAVGRVAVPCNVFFLPSSPCGEHRASM